MAGADNRVAAAAAGNGHRLPAPAGAGRLGGALAQTAHVAPVAAVALKRRGQGGRVKNERILSMDEIRIMPVLGLVFGIALGFAGAFGGVAAFVIVLVLGLVGYFAGRAIAGELDLTALFVSRTRRPQ